MPSLSLPFPLPYSLRTRAGLFSLTACILVATVLFSYTSEGNHHSSDDQLPNASAGGRESRWGALAPLIPSKNGWYGGGEGDGGDVREGSIGVGVGGVGIKCTDSGLGTQRDDPALRWTGAHPGGYEGWRDQSIQKWDWCECGFVLCWALSVER